MNEFIKDFLPIFMIAFMACLFLWNEFRKKKLAINKGSKILERVNYKFYLMFMGALLIAFLYSFAPDLYQYLLPIEDLDHPFINFTGIQILKASLIWIIIYQFKLTSLWTIFFRNRVDEDEDNLHVYSHKVLMGGLVLMFLGLFVTISSFAAILLVTLAFMEYNKYFLSEEK